jgi:hypothetical protein
MLGIYRKKPVTVSMILWDGTGRAAAEIAAWVGEVDPGVPGFRVAAGAEGAEVWAAQEECWVDCPVGHHVVRGRLGEYYPISAEALAQSYDYVVSGETAARRNESGARSRTKTEQYAIRLVRDGIASRAIASRAEDDLDEDGLLSIEDRGHAVDLALAIARVIEFDPRLASVLVAEARALRLLL